MPSLATAAGEAFELLASRHLVRTSGLSHVAAPFYTRLRRGKWVQFDGLFARDDAATLALEAKFYAAPVSLSTPGVAARINFTKELRLSGIVLASRCGFARDIMRLKMPIEKVLLSWRGIRRALTYCESALVTAALDPVERSARGFRAASGAVLVTDVDWLDESRDGFAFAPREIERWLRRLAASPRDINLSRPPRAFSPSRSLDIESAWAIEDSLRGFAPSAPDLLVKAIRVLSDGPLSLDEAWRKLWRAGYRGKRGGVVNALANLRVIGAAERFRSARGTFWELACASQSGAEDILRTAVEAWPAYVWFRKATRGAARDKHELAARLAEDFAPMWPYARSLYNPAKVAGLLALEDYFSGTSTSRPS